MKNGLVSFLYVLLRDRLPAGEVELPVRDHVEKAQGKEITFSNPYIESYARELAERILR